MCEPGDFIEQMPNRLSVNQLILIEWMWTRWFYLNVWTRWFHWTNAKQIICEPADFTWMCEPGDFIKQMPNRLSLNQVILLECVNQVISLNKCQTGYLWTSWFYLNVWTRWFHWTNAKQIICASWFYLNVWTSRFHWTNAKQIICETDDFIWIFSKQI